MVIGEQRVFHVYFIWIFCRLLQSLDWFNDVFLRKKEPGFHGSKATMMILHKKAKVGSSPFTLLLKSCLHYIGLFSPSRHTYKDR